MNQSTLGDYQGGGSSNGSDEHTCPTCGKTYGSYKWVSRHHKSEHGTTLTEEKRKEGEYDCPSCEDAFDSERGLNVHHSKAHGESLTGPVRTGDVECPNCDRAFASRAGLGAHHSSAHGCSLTEYERQTRGGDECPNCGVGFESLGHHWALSSDCDFPPLSDTQIEVVEGMLLGDGFINDPGGTGHKRFGTSMVNRPFLEHLNDVLSPFSNDIGLSATAEESAQGLVDSGLNDTPSDTHDVYRFHTTPHPTFTKLRDKWYPGGEKHFPESLELTPTMAKYWYVGDGSLQWDSRNPETRRPYTVFGALNEVHRPEYLCGLFEDHGFTAYPTGYGFSLNADSSQEFLEWIGEPPQGFEYKWENGSYDEYLRLKDEAYGWAGE